MFTIFLLKKMPDTGNRGSHINPMDSAKRLFKNRSWKGGVIAQTFYVAAQITCWTFIIQYAMENVSGMTMSKAQNYNIGAMALFLVSRFICTFLLKYFSPGKLLMQLSTLAAILMLFTIFLQKTHYFQRKHAVFSSKNALFSTKKCTIFLSKNAL